MRSLRLVAIFVDQLLHLSAHSTFAPCIFVLFAAAYFSLFFVTFAFCYYRILACLRSFVVRFSRFTFRVLRFAFCVALPRSFHSRTRAFCGYRSFSFYVLHCVARVTAGSDSLRLVCASYRSFSLDGSHTSHYLPQHAVLVMRVPVARTVLLTRLRTLRSMPFGFFFFFFFCLFCARVYGLAFWILPPRTYALDFRSVYRSFSPLFALRDLLLIYLLSFANTCTHALRSRSSVLLRRVFTRSVGSAAMVHLVGRHLSFASTVAQHAFS